MNIQRLYIKIKSISGKRKFIIDIHIHGVILAFKYNFPKFLLISKITRDK